MHGKATLSDVYEDLEDFFVNDLGVSLLTLEVVYDELIQLGRASLPPSVKQIKGQIWAFNSLLASSEELPSPTPLLESPIFPVSEPNGQIALCDAKTEFAIIDRAPLEESFAAQVKTLNFACDEVRQLDRFFRWLNLESRYLSRAVKEISTVQGMEKCPTSSKDRLIRPKAHALCR